MNKLTLILGIVCVVFLALWLRSCQSKPFIPLPGDKKVDSITAILKVHDSAHFKVIDSVQGLIKVAIKERDSAINQLTIIKGNLKGKDKDIAGLVEELNNAQQSHDTSQILTLCDSLKRAYPVAKGLVTAYILKNDSLIALNTQIIGTKNTVIAHLNQMFIETNNGLFETSRQYGILSENYKKEVKKAGKRFGFGPQITVTVVDGKIGVLPGIGLSYTLLKF